MYIFQTAARILGGLLLALGAASAAASSSWTLTDSSSNEPAVSGWKATSNTSAIAGASLGYWAGSGVGVGGESAPQHSLDNVSGYEAALLSFDQQVRVETVNVGWSTNDADYFVLAYTSATPFSGTVTGSFSTLVANGWSLVGNYSGTGVTTLNTAPTLYSSFWLIGAGGFESGIGVTSGDTYSGGGWRSLGSTYGKYDYVKVAAVGGTVKVPPPGGSVPEPGSLVLAGLGLLGMLGVRRRRKLA